MSESMCTIKKETKAVFVASKECGLDMNVRKQMYIFMAHEQNTGQKTQHVDKW